MNEFIPEYKPFLLKPHSAIVTLDDAARVLQRRWRQRTRTYPVVGGLWSLNDPITLRPDAVPRSNCEDSPRPVSDDARRQSFDWQDRWVNLRDQPARRRWMMPHDTLYRNQVKMENFS